MYGARLAAMRPLIVAAAKASLGNHIQVKKIANYILVKNFQGGFLLVLP